MEYIKKCDQVAHDIAMEKFLVDGESWRSSYQALL